MVHKSNTHVPGGSGGGVTTIDGISGAVTLVAGSGISITDNTPSAGDITITATGGGGTPGGSNTDVQFNNSGAFGGDTNFTYDGTNLTVPNIITPSINIATDSTFSLGNSASAVGMNAIAIGTGATVDGADYGVAIGTNDPSNFGNPYVGAEQGLAIGGGAQVYGVSAIAIGPCVSAGYASVAIGLGEAAGDNSICISTGLGNTTGTDSICIGQGNADGASSLMLGSFANAEGDYSMALGLTSAGSGGAYSNANVSGTGSFGIIMQEQRGRTLTANNMMMLLGGTFVIDPSTGFSGPSITASRATFDIGRATDAIILPSGTTAQEPSSPVAGMIRYNTSTPGIEAYYNTAWNTLGTGSSFAWNEITTTTVTFAVNNGYIMNNASRVTGTLPATAAQGSIIEVAGKGAGGWKIGQNAGQTIHFDGNNTTTGTGGSLSSQATFDSVRLLCITANTDFSVISSIGNISGV